MSNPLSGTHKILRQPGLHYVWGILDRDVALAGLVGLSGIAGLVGSKPRKHYS